MWSILRDEDNEYRNAFIGSCLIVAAELALICAGVAGAVIWLRR